MVLWIVIGMLILGIMTTIIWKLAVISQTPKKVPVTITPDLPYEDISFISGTDEVKGWFIPSETKDYGKAPLVILVHGWGANRARMLRYVKPLYQSGYSLLLFDVRSHGESDSVKALTVEIFRDDCIAAIQYSKSRTDIDPNQIGILAHSFGGFGSIIANKEDLGINAVVSDSAPCQFSTIMKASLKRFKLPYYPLGPIMAKIMFIRAGISRKELREFMVPQAIQNRKSPILMIHSKKDDYVPSTELDYILGYVNILHLYVESIGHRSSEKDPQFWKTVLPFLKENLSNNIMKQN